MRVLLLGATKGMGRALARKMSERGDELFLLGRNLDDLRRTAEDVRVRGASQQAVGVALCDLERPETFGPALQEARTRLDFDTVVVSAALFGTQDRLEADPEFTQRVLSVAFTNTVLFCERARAHLLERGGGRLCVFSSVAGDRARKPVVLYGAAKAGLSAYLEGLDHRFRSQGLITICVKPGFVTTSMTEGLPRPPFAGDPEAVAARVLTAIDRGWPVVYVPGIWRLVLLPIRAMPRFAMRRLGF